MPNKNEKANMQNNNKNANMPNKAMMMKKARKRKIIQQSIKIIFLALFVVLFIFGRIQLWIAVFAAGIIISIFFGRFYCGWMCPINTIMRAISWVKKKLHIRSFKTPKFLTKTWVRFLALEIFVALFVFVMVTGKQLPVLPGLLVIGVVLTLFFPEEVWHRYLCPYGTILSFTSIKALFAVQINEDKCINQGHCKRVCPAVAVDDSGEKHKIKSNDCLICLSCVRACQEKAISFGRKTKVEKVKKQKMSSRKKIHRKKPALNILAGFLLQKCIDMQKVKKLCEKNKKISN